MIKQPLLHGFRRLLLFSIPFLLYLTNASLAQIITGRPPQFSKFPHNSYSPLEGTEFSIKCPLLYDTYQIEWFKDGESLGKSSLILSIPSISRIDSGIYKCYTYNGIGGAFSPSINISVTYFDGFKQVSESFYKIKVPPSGYFSLKPPPLNASPNSKLTWKWKFEEQEIFTNDTHYISANGDLIILEAARRFGIYRVEVISEKSSAISLEYTVEEEIGDAAPPNFAIVYRPRDILILDDTSTSATFECVPSIWNKFPAEINWLLNGNELTVDGLEVRTEFSNRRLILSNVVNLVGKSNFNSKITCEATTSDERLIEKADAKLEIYEKPIINKEKLEKEVTKKIGDSFKME
uniref:Ig-like domain-containing protein n=1 Tax=Acrobeloides nanus TaxID=290746 RepID=A0A914E3I3_9BILA